MKFTTFMILLVLSSCVVEVECKFRARASPMIRSRSTQVNRMKRLQRKHNYCKEYSGNGTTLNDYYCDKCKEKIGYCDYSYLPSITQKYCLDLATNVTYQKIPYYCSVCLSDKHSCISPKSLDFKRFETIKVFDNCSNYPMDAHECVQYCKVDKLLPKNEFLECSNSSATYEFMAIGFNLMIAYAVYKGIQLAFHIIS